MLALASVSITWFERDSNLDKLRKNQRFIQFPGEVETGIRAV